MKGPFNITNDNLKIVYFNEQNFKILWNSFLKEYKNYSYKYEITVIEYYELISEKCLNKTFLIKNHESVLAICPFIIESLSYGKQGSIYGGKDYIPIALFNKHLTEKQKNNLEKTLFDEVRKNLKKTNASRAFFQADSVSVKLEDIYDTYLDKELALDMSSVHHIIDLSVDEKDLWQQIRHSSKSIINKGLDIFEFKIYDKSNFNEDIGEKHRIMHHEISGKITRPLASFKKMSSWVKEGRAVLIEQSYKKEIAQMIYIVLGGQSAAGASVVENIKIKTPIPMTHSLNYFIYKEMKKRNIKFYDVGLTSFRSSIFTTLTKKEQDINYFKRGFGLRNFPLRMWGWFENNGEEINFLKNKLDSYEKKQKRN